MGTTTATDYTTVKKVDVSGDGIYQVGAFTEYRGKRLVAISVEPRTGLSENWSAYLQADGMQDVSRGALVGLPATFPLHRRVFGESDNVVFKPVDLVVSGTGGGSATVYLHFSF